MMKDLLNLLIPIVQAAEQKIPVAQQIGNFYAWAVGISALVALGIIVYAGLAYTAAGGNASRQADAKQWIWGALIGLLLLFGSYLILNTVNPELTHLQDPSLILTQGGEVEGGGGKISRGLVKRSATCPSGVRKNCSLKYLEFAKLARSYATPLPATNACGYPSNKKLQAYIKAPPTDNKKATEDPSDNDGAPDYYGADCGTYVATVITQTIDPNWPIRGTWLMADYVEKGKGKEKFDFIHLESMNTSKLKPGDILLSEDVNEHVAIWLDDGVYQASWSSQGCSHSLFPRGPEPRPNNNLLRVYRYKGW